MNGARLGGIATGLQDQLDDQSRPACLVAGPESCAIVPVKALVEQDQIPPIRVPAEQVAARFSGLVVDAESLSAWTRRA